MSKKRITVQFTLKYATISLVIIALASFAYFRSTQHNTKHKSASKNIVLFNQSKKMSFDEWRKQPGNLTLSQAKDRKTVAFDLKFPKDESLTGNLEVINSGGNYKGTGAATDIMIMFSKGINVSQILPDPNEARGLANEPDTLTTQEPTKKDFKKVNINGVEGVAAEPKINDNTFGEAYKSNGSVSWYKNGIRYTVYGNGNIPVDQLLRIAQLFN